MKLITKSILSGTLVGILAIGLAANTSAAEVRAGLSSRETYVGLPITLQVQVSGNSDTSPPSIPSVDGLEIKSLGPPSRSTQITTINGQVTTSSSVTYSYGVTPQRTGSFHIPPIAIQAGGKPQQSRALDLVASKSETGDLLFVEIAGKTKQIYVGQALDLTLKIWLRPFRDRERGITLSEADMWHMISERSSWGSFAERVSQLADANQRPAGKETLRKDSDGAEHSYYLYEINATIYPKRPGKIDANDVKIVVNYPTALGQSRDPFSSFFGNMSGGRGGQSDDDEFFSPFGSRLTVESVRPVIAEASVEPIDVMQIPTADRPADYRGAVGKYRIAVEASPSNVKAGDPINLLIGIAGNGPMDLVQAPPLAELPALTADFKVPNEPLAGFVKGERKVFSTEIRPRRAGITQVPPIPFSYFDPEMAKFVTVHSEPVTIQVAQAETLALDAVVGHGKSSSTGSGAAPTSATAAAGPSVVLTNFTGDSLLSNEAAFPLFSWPLALLVAVPPAVVLGLYLTRNRLSISSLSHRFGSTARRIRAQLDDAQSPREVAEVLQVYLQKQLRLNPTNTDVVAIAGALRSIGDRKLAVHCERLLQDCARPTVSGLGGAPSLTELKRDAVGIINDLQSQRKPPRPKPVPSKRRSATASRASKVATMIALMTTMLIASGSVQAAETRTDALTATNLSSEQQATLLSEANDRYSQALAIKDSADAKQQFSDAAEKYQLLLDSGVRNSRLFFNAANAYLQSGQSGRAIANYRRALQIDPTNRDAQKNLAYAERQARPTAAGTGAKVAVTSTSSLPLRVNHFLNSYIAPRSVLAIAVCAWFALWAFLGLRLLDIRFPWKSMSTAAILLLATLGASYTLSRQASEVRMAVVIPSEAMLRTGDGENFPTVPQSRLSEGNSVELLKERGDWVQIRTDGGETGWLPTSSVEII